jgi:hypothetical protein
MTDSDDYFFGGSDGGGSTSCAATGSVFVSVETHVCHLIH